MVIFHVISECDPAIKQVVRDNIKYNQGRESTSPGLFRKC